MSKIHVLQDKLRQIIKQKNLSEDDYNNALSLFDDYDDNHLPPHLLVLKAHLIKYSTLENYQLEDIAKYLNMALTVQHNYWEALLGLANFNNIQNEDKVAQEYFRQAVNAVVDIAVEVLQDYGQFLLQDPDQQELAVQAMEEIKARIFGSPEIQQIYRKEEWYNAISKEQ